MDHSRPPRFTPPSPSDQLLVRAAIGGDDLRECWERWLAGVVYDDVPYREARLIPQVFASFQQRGIGDVLPPRMRGQYRWVFASNQLRCHAVAPALGRLARAGIPTLVLKGAALLASGRTSWGAREMGDVDVLVPSGRRADAASVFEGAGWRGAEGVTAEFVGRRLTLRRHSWNFVRDSGHDNIDLHWHVFEGRADAAIEDALWSRACDAVFGEARVQRLDDVDQMLHIMEHAAHGEGSNELVWIADCARLLDAVDGGEVARRSRELGVFEVAGEASRIVADTIATPSARRLAESFSKLEPSRAERRLAQTDVGRVLRRERPRLSETLRTLRLHGVERRPLTAAALLRRRRVEPHLCARPALSTALALVGRPRRAEVAALRALGPFARPPAAETVALGEWIDLTTGAGLDRVAGPGWTWPSPRGTWSDGESARLAVAVDSPRGQDLVLELCFGEDVDHSPNGEVDVLVNGRPVMTWTFGVGPEHAPPRIDIPAWLADWCRPLDIAFRPCRPFPPRARGFAAGDVQRAVQLRALRVTVRPPA